jgi:hypothetical protein
MSILAATFGLVYVMNVMFSACQAPIHPPLSASELSQSTFSKLKQENVLTDLVPSLHLLLGILK